jgi:hypothetical protein
MASGIVVVRFLNFKLSHPTGSGAGAALHTHSLVGRDGVRLQFAEFQGSCAEPMELPKLSVELGRIAAGQDIDVTWLLTLCEGCASMCMAEASPAELEVVQRQALSIRENIDRVPH